MIQDDRGFEDIARTIGFWVATDRFLSGWGLARGGRSLVACPVHSADDSEIVERRFRLRREFQCVRYVAGCMYRPKLRTGDHLHVYGFDSFRYPL